MGLLQIILTKESEVLTQKDYTKPNLKTRTVSTGHLGLNRFFSCDSILICMFFIYLHSFLPQQRTASLDPFPSHPIKALDCLPLLPPPPLPPAWRGPTRPVHSPLQSSQEQPSHSQGMTMTSLYEKTSCVKVWPLITWYFTFSCWL